MFTGKNVSKIKKEIKFEENDDEIKFEEDDEIKFNIEEEKEDKLKIEDSEEENKDEFLYYGKRNLERKENFEENNQKTKQAKIEEFIEKDIELTNLLFGDINSTILEKPKTKVEKESNEKPVWVDTNNYNIFFEMSGIDYKNLIIDEETKKILESPNGQINGEQYEKILRNTYFLF
jgi:hypothetical protein